MSMPNIPDIKPKLDVDFDEVVNILLASIALEELSLAHILNAEGEKIQCITGDKCKAKLDDLLAVNESVNKNIKNVIKKEILLEFKFENILELIDKMSKKKKHKEDED